MRNRQAGVTLLELLIAVSLVGLLSVGMLLAIRAGLDAMGTTRRVMLERRRLAGAERVLEMQLASLMAVVADCRSAPQGPVTRVPFFQGEPQSMRFVTSYSIREGHRGRPKIVEYRVIPMEDEPGVRLVVNERPYAGPASTGALCLGPEPEGPGIRYLPIEVGPDAFVLADRLARCEFSYQLPTPEPRPPAWVPRWTGQLLPAAIRIVMEPLEPGGRRQPVLPVVAPVRVTKNPLFAYAYTD